MKRFFIFATMLVALTVNAWAVNDDPPLIMPDSDIIILHPQDVHDIDRRLHACQYMYDANAGEIILVCQDTGIETEVYLLDMAGAIIDYTSFSCGATVYARLDVPKTSASYVIVIQSEKYYGEGFVHIE